MIDVPAPAVRGRVNSTFLCFFVIFGPSRDCMMPIYIGEASLLYSVY